MLAQRQEVDVDDVSRTGCRLTGVHSMEVGDLGVLTVVIDDAVLVECFRVARRRMLPGTNSLYQVGIEFLPMPGGQGALHELAARLDDAHSM